MSFPPWAAALGRNEVRVDDLERHQLLEAADAVRARDIQSVQLLLDARPELVHMDMAASDEHRALHYAVLDRAPEMVRLLMARDFRAECFARIHKAAQELSVLGGLTREYSLREIAIMTRAGPARILGLADRGRLTPGALADIAVYRKQSDVEAMFRTPDHVFKSGIEIARAGAIAAMPSGVTQVVKGSLLTQDGKVIHPNFVPA